MKKSILALAALAFMAWGCSSDDENSSQPTEITAGTDVRPTWQAPNYDLYEQAMVVEVQLQDTLTKYVSSQDLLCATIGGEVRGVAAPQQVEDKYLFPLTIPASL